MVIVCTSSGPLTLIQEPPWAGSEKCPMLMSHTAMQITEITCDVWMCVHVYVHVNYVCVEFFVRISFWTKRIPMERAPQRGAEWRKFQVCITFQ